MGRWIKPLSGILWPGITGILYVGMSVSKTTQGGILCPGILRKLLSGTGILSLGIIGILTLGTMVYFVLE